MAEPGKNGSHRDEPPQVHGQAEPNPEFLSLLAHELRTPLSPIRNGAELLRTLCDDPRQLQTVEMISRHVVHLTHMLDDLLDAAYLRRGLIALKKQRVDAAAIAEQALEAIRPAIDARRQNLLVSLPSAPVQMHCDPVRLVQVVQNLLDNANRYTADGGAIVLKMELEGESLVIEVADNGAGIAPALLPRLFNVFASGEQQSEPPTGRLGLGLAIARNLVEMHGGSITADSEGSGRGSRFVVRLPLERVQLAPQPPPATASSCYRILVIDDHADLAQRVAEYFSQHGHLTATAATGESGIDVAREFKPDAVIIDIGLPGMDGFEVAQALRSMPGIGTPLLIAVSGYSMKTFRNINAYSLFKHYLLKPTNPETLASIVERALQMHVKTV